ncbi:MAG: tripartite tricarboxylate transporter substrate binding protein [Acetobacteraceae bacterium]|nr:tripartite tricarboxylate transporter substrate binding protein [Acetobacteraceae bacterium]
MRDALSRRHGIALAGALLAAPGLARAQDAWPGGPVRLIVASAPGGNPDLMGRLVAEPLAAALGQAVVVENRAGASGNIGAQGAAQARPDGNTLLFGMVNHAINMSLFANSGYDFVRDFEPVAQLYLIPNVLLVANALPVHNVAELVAMARERPGQLNFASSGVGTTLHLGGELFRQLANIDIVHIPYRGSAEAHQDLQAGRVHMIFDNLPPAIARIESGAVRALAITSATRSPRLPEVPTVGEAGFPQLEMLIWGGVFAPSRTPAPVMARLQAELDRITETPAFRQRLAQLGSLPVGRDREAFRRFIAAETDRWRGVVERAGIRGQ